MASFVRSAKARYVKDETNTDQQKEAKQDIYWQVSKPSLKDRLLYLCNSDFMSDVTFVVQNKRISAHKVFLATSSPVFDAMFNGPLAPPEKSEIEIPDCLDSNAFTEFLRYFYVGESNFVVSDPCTILYLAKKYIVPGLEKSCRSYIANGLGQHNVFAALYFSFQLDDEEVKELCTNFICGNIHNLAKAESFLQLNLECLTYILGSDNLLINEIDLFLAVDKWCTKEVERRRTSKGSSITKRSVLGDALYLIRFPVISSKEFVDHCAYSDLLSADEARDVFCYIHHLERQPASHPRFGFAQQQQSNAMTSFIEKKLKFPKTKRTLGMHTATRCGVAW